MHTMNLGSELLEKLQRESESAKAKSEKAALLKLLSDFCDRNANRTGSIRLSGFDVGRLIDLIGDKNPALTQRLTGCTQISNDVTLLPGEGELLYRLVLNS